MKKLLLLTGGKLPYHKRIKRLFGSSLIGYWPLWETSGTTAMDISGNGRNAVYSGVVLGANASVTNKYCPVFDGTNDFVNFYTSSFNSVFNGKEGSAFFIAKHNSSYWTDGIARYDFSIYPNNDNNMAVMKAADGTYKATYKASSITKTAPIPVGSENFMILGMAWSYTSGYIRSYLNGKLLIETSGIGLWQDPSLLNTTTVFGGLSTSGGNSGLIGIASDLIIVNRPVSEAEALEIFKIFCPGYKTISITGDSISSNFITNWHTDTTRIYNSGKCLTNNHAMGGQEILTRFSEQVYACTGDNADIIIHQLGTNDNNSGNMTTLQQVVEDGLATIKLTNPNAQQFYMNVLPRWTDTGGGTEVDKSNIRTAIASACIAQGVTCWDTYTTPWITASDTSDGVHPTAAGHAKIAAEVLARL